MRLESSPSRSFEVDVQPFDDLPKLRDKLFLLHNLQLQDYTLHVLSGGITNPSALSESVPVSAMGIGKGSVLIARRKDAAAATPPSAASESPPTGSPPRGHHHSTSSSGSIPRSPMQHSASPMHTSSYSTLPPMPGKQLSVPLSGRRPSTGDPFAQLEDTLSMISPRQPQTPGTPRTPGSMGPASPMQGAAHMHPEHARRPSGPQKKYNTLPHAHARAATAADVAQGAPVSPSPRPQLIVVPPPTATAAVAPPPAGAHHPPLSRTLSSPLSPSSSNPFDLLDRLSPSLTGGSSLGGPPRRLSTSQQQQQQPSQHQIPSPRFQASGSFPSSNSLPRSLSISAHSESNWGSSSGTPPLAPSPSHASLSSSTAAAPGSDSRRGSDLPPPVSVSMPTANSFVVMESPSSPQERRGTTTTNDGAAAQSAPDALASLFGLCPTPVHPSPALVESSASASVLAASPHLSVLLEAVRHESADQNRDREEQLELRGFKLTEVLANVEKMIASRAALLESHAKKLAEINERIRDAQAVESAEEQKCSAQQRDLDREQLALLDQLHSIERRTDQHALDLTQRRLALDTWAATDRRAQLGGLALQREEHDAAWRQDRDRLVDRTVEQLLMAGDEFAEAVLEKLNAKIEAKKKVKTEAAAAAAAATGINRSRRSSDAAAPSTPVATLSSLSPDPVLLALDRLSSNPQGRPSAETDAAAPVPAPAAASTAVDAAPVAAPASNS